MSTTSNRIQIYGTRLCGFCAAAKRLAERIGVPYDEILLDQDPELRMELSQKTGHRSVPMIFVDGAFVGGFQEFRVMAEKGDLTSP
jgi:glutaredoxin 3